MDLVDRTKVSQMADVAGLGVDEREGPAGSSVAVVGCPIGSEMRIGGFRAAPRATGLAA